MRKIFVFLLLTAAILVSCGQQSPVQKLPTQFPPTYTPIPTPTPVPTLTPAVEVVTQIPLQIEAGKKVTMENRGTGEMIVIENKGVVGDWVINWQYSYSRSAAYPFQKGLAFYDCAEAGCEASVNTYLPSGWKAALGSDRSTMDLIYTSDWQIK